MSASLEFTATRAWSEFVRYILGSPIYLGLFISTVLLFLCWGFLAVRRRRLYSALGAIALSFAALIYVTYDWRHLSLSLSMRNPQQVRKDCEQLLQKQKTASSKEYREMYLRGPEIPPSLARLGAKFVRVTGNNIQISLIPESGFGGAWGYLYFPTARTDLAEAWPMEIRSTWYRDFYEFRLRGE